MSIRLSLDFDLMGLILFLFFFFKGFVSCKLLAGSALKTLVI